MLVAASIWRTCALGVAACLAKCAVAQGPAIDWVLRFGAERRDVAYAVQSDGQGGAFVGGSIERHPNGDDIFVARYDANGVQRWLRQIGDYHNEWVYALAPDDEGGVFVCGGTQNALAAPNPSFGIADIVVARYEADGNQLWIRQFGSPTIHDAARAMVSDGSGGVIVTGEIGGNLTGEGGDTFVARYDSQGNRLWLHQFGVGHNLDAFGIALDGSGGFFVSGSAYPDNALGWYPFLASCDSGGLLRWLRVDLSPYPNGAGFAVVGDELGGAYLTGRMHSGSTVNSYDSFVSRYDATGRRIWTRSFGEPGGQAINGIVRMLSGDLLVAGTAAGVGWGPNAGDQDVFVAQLNESGTPIWSRQFGWDRRDIGLSLAADPQDGVFVAGISSIGSQYHHTEALLARVDLHGCIADCDADGRLSMADLGCFMTRFAVMDPYADCDGDELFTVADFACFQSKYIAGCP